MLLNSCHNHDHSGHDHSGHSHGHDHGHSHGHQHTGSLWEKIFHNHDHDDHGHAHDTEHNTDDTSIVISEKKQKTLGIETMVIGNNSVSASKTTSLQFTGKVVRASSDHWEAIASVDGQLSLAKNFNTGDKVKKGSPLFTVSGKNFTEGNIERDKAMLNAEIKEAEAGLVLAKTDFERAQKAIEFKVISKDKFEHSKTSFEQAQIKLNSLKEQLNSVGLKYGNNTQTVYAQKSGYIESLEANNGSFVNAGQAVIGFYANDEFMAEFQIPSDKMNTLNKTIDANLISGDQKLVLNEFQNTFNLVNSNQAQLNYQTIHVPVNTNNLYPGTMITLDLLFDKNNTDLKNNIQIPKSAVLEDFGLYYCYVEIEKDHFEQRPLEISERNLQTISIKNGLVNGEKIVTKNPLQVKFSGVAAVGHSHDH